MSSAVSTFHSRDSVVIAGAGQLLSVGTESQFQHPVSVAGEGGADGLARIASHSRTVASSPALARRRPSGLNATVSTLLLMCPVSGGPTCWPVSAFHSRTVPSSAPAVARWCPSGLNATSSTESVWPVIGGPTG